LPETAARATAGGRRRTAKDDIYLALKRMNERQNGRLPVMDGGRLVGILSRSDVMRGFHLRQLQSR